MLHVHTCKLQSDSYEKHMPLLAPFLKDVLEIENADSRLSSRDLMHTEIIA